MSVSLLPDSPSISSSLTINFTMATTLFISFVIEFLGLVQYKKR